MLTVTERIEPEAVGDAAALDDDRALESLAPFLLEESWRPDEALAALASGRDVAAQLALTAAAARALGERWLEDSCGFADVTLGLHRLTLLLMAAERRADAGRRPAHGGRALLAAAPDDQHGFGVALVAFTLRRAGWDVAVDLSGDAEALLGRIVGGRFDAVGLSIGHDRAVAPSRAVVARLRAAAGAGVRPVIAVGGPMLARRPDLAAEVGADLACADADALARRLAQAVRLA